jgi:signal transduction histidine kinase
MAHGVADGDLSVRMPQTDVGEIGVLEGSLNTMAASLEESHDRLQRLVAEQAALRRVATLVARGRPADEVFAAVAQEMAVVLDAGASMIVRRDADGLATVVARYGGDRVPEIEVGRRWRFRPPSPTAIVLESGRPHRTDDPGDLSPPFANALENLTSAVASPIFVEGRLWGSILIGSNRAAFATDTEDRMAAFIELLGTAVANAQGRGELIASRARIVAASDDARRKIERDLHDGTQQRLVSLGLELREVAHALPAQLDGARDQLGRVSDGLEEVLENLREISRGIHPAILSQGGLVPALKALARRSKVPVELDVDVDSRLPEQIEVAAYYLVSESLTNAAKHAQATLAEVHAGVSDSSLELRVQDDGVGGADPTKGSGLVGLRDRAAALGGSIEFASPRGAGTTMTVRLPIPADGARTSARD